MILDSSAVVAILRREPEASAMVSAIAAAPSRVMATPSVLELTLVLRAENAHLADTFIHETGLILLPFTAEQLRWARHAHAIYGRGSGSPAKLNFGDCLVYGAARAERQPLLCKGNDFLHTDLELVEY